MCLGRFRGDSLLHRGMTCRTLSGRTERATTTSGVELQPAAGSLAVDEAAKSESLRCLSKPTALHPGPLLVLFASAVSPSDAPTEASQRHRGEHQSRYSIDPQAKRRLNLGPGRVPGFDRRPAELLRRRLRLRRSRC